MEGARLDAVTDTWPSSSWCCLGVEARVEAPGVEAPGCPSSPATDAASETEEEAASETELTVSPAKLGRDTALFASKSCQLPLVPPPPLLALAKPLLLLLGGMLSLRLEPKATRVCYHGHLQYPVEHNIKN